MLLANLPAKILSAFANAGNKRTVPLASQIGITPGAASFADGFPPLNATPVASGGVPPSVQDFNGILNQMSVVQAWQCGGGNFPYDTNWIAANGGYPKGALLLKADGSGYWLNGTDNNSANPDTGGAGWVDLGAGLGVIGAGQAWQDFTSSRVSGTTYTNTTGRPITLSITMAGTSTAGGDVYVNGTVICSMSTPTTSSLSINSTVIVPAGATYKFATSGIGFSNWKELR